MKNGLSIIMPYHNEGKKLILETIDSIETTIDVEDYEIIVVDDFSDTALKIDHVKVIRHLRNLGVGKAFDTGVIKAKYNNLFLCGCDVRFVNNGWASKMMLEIKNRPNSLICTSVVALYDYQPEITFEASRKLYRYNGATILFLHGHSDSPDRPKDFHSILNAQWLPREYLPLRRPGTIDRMESYEVACILGAAYGCTKKWYLYLDGFWGHRQWGTLEPYISLKCHLFGGKCYTAPHIETGHIFKSEGTHNTQIENIFYNKLLVSYLLFSDEDYTRLVDWLPDNEYLTKAKEIFKNNLQELTEKRDEYRNKMVVSIGDMVRKFNINF